MCRMAGFWTVRSRHAISTLFFTTVGCLSPGRRETTAQKEEVIFEYSMVGSDTNVFRVICRGLFYRCFSANYAWSMEIGRHTW